MKLRVQIQPMGFGSMSILATPFIPGRSVAGTNQPYDRKRALSYCMWLLGRRMYTEAQLRDKLRAKGTADADVDAVLARLRELHLTDDGAFAEAFVRGRRRRKGRIALRQELRAKGVGETDIAAALAPIDDEAAVATAAEIVAKHAWRFASGDRRKDRAKAYAFLARRGFRTELIASVTREEVPSRPHRPPALDSVAPVG